jgi:AraC family transcriptional regulator
MDECPYYLEALGAFAARHIVSPLTEKSKSQNPAGLPHPQLRRILEHMDRNLRKEIKTGDLARIAGFGQHHFTRLFKVSTGMTPRRFIIMRKFECARELHLKGGMGAAEVADASGASSLNAPTMKPP